MTDYIKDNLPYSQETSQIIKSFYTVYNQLGFGFDTIVYKSAIYQELSKSNLKSESDKTVSIYYNSVHIGNFIADIVVCDIILLSIKSSNKIEDLDEQLLYNRLRNSELKIGLLLNFGIKPEFCRKSPNDTQINKFNDLPFD